jgi:SHS2 domain-containing protein
MGKKFKFLEHTADVKFQAFGKTIEEVFENSGLALINSQYKGKIKAVKKKKIKVKGKDNEALLYNFLEDILILLEKGFLTSKIKVKIKDKTLSAELTGDSTKNYEISVDVKAVTYNQMFVREEKKGKWIAQVVIDV